VSFVIVKKMAAVLMARLHRPVFQSI